VSGDERKEVCARDARVSEGVGDGSRVFGGAGERVGEERGGGGGITLVIGGGVGREGTGDSVVERRMRGHHGVGERWGDGRGEKWEGGGDGGNER